MPAFFMEKQIMNKRTRFGAQKLVRDKTITRCEKNDIAVNARILTDKEYIYELKKKLIEEAEEVLLAKDDAELIEELADVLEVLEVLVEKAGIAKEHIAAEQSEKNETRGSFKEGIYVEYFDVPVGNHWHEYCSQNPDKYPILKDDIESE